jgi:hypothetical protein
MTRFQVFAKAPDDFTPLERDQITAPFADNKMPSAKIGYEFQSVGEAEAFIRRVLERGFLVNVTYVQQVDFETVSDDCVYILAFPFDYRLFNQEGLLDVDRAKPFEVATDQSRLLFAAPIARDLEALSSRVQLERVPTTGEPWFAMREERVPLLPAPLRVVRATRIAPSRIRPDAVDVFHDGRLVAPLEVLAFAARNPIFAIEQFRDGDVVHPISKRYGISAAFCRAMLKTNPALHTNLEATLPENDPAASDILSRYINAPAPPKFADVR